MTFVLRQRSGEGFVRSRDPLLITGSVGEAEQFATLELAAEAADGVNGLGRVPVVPVEVVVDGPQRPRYVP